MASSENKSECIMKPLSVERQFSIANAIERKAPSGKLLGIPRTAHIIALRFF
jgi:hypothetical protein